MNNPNMLQTKAMQSSSVDQTRSIGVVDKSSSLLKTTGQKQGLPDAHLTEKFQNQLESRQGKSHQEDHIANDTQTIVEQKKQESGSHHNHHVDETFVMTDSAKTQRVGDQILSNLLPSNPTKAAQMSDETVMLVEKLVDKMWVKTAANAQQKEIVMRINEGHLINTDLKIVRSESGLVIQLTTSDAATYRLLAANQMQLRKQLQKKHDIDAVEITANVANSEQSTLLAKTPYADKVAK